MTTMKEWERTMAGEHHRRQCRNCGSSFDCPASSRRQFCDDTCKAENLRRRQARGLLIIDLALMWWDGGELSELPPLTDKLQLMLDQDREAGRPSW